MKKIIQTSLTVAILATSLFSAEYKYGPVRDFFENKKPFSFSVNPEYFPVTIDENTTLLQRPDSTYHRGRNADLFFEACQAIGGDNLYAYDKSGKELARWFDADGNKTQIVKDFESQWMRLAALFVSKDGAVNFGVFDFRAKDTIWTCKQKDKELFSVYDWTSSQYYKGREPYWTINYKVEHGPEKSTPYKEVKSHASMNEIGKVKRNIVNRVVSIKSNYTHISGNLEYLGTYNGKNFDGCDLVSIIERKPDGSAGDVDNYKSCNGKVEWTGKTMPAPKLTKQVEAIIARTAKTCQQTGAANSGVDNYFIDCRALRDKDRCTVEVSILNEQNQLVDKRIMNGCN